MRLIDADELLKDWNANIPEYNGGFSQRKDTIAIINRQPTAYDIDKVMVALEKASFWTDSTYDEDGYSNDDADEVIFLDKAIKIVKAGGKNDD